MQLIRRGKQLGQAVKNVQRLRQILGTFAKYGFVDLANRAKLGKFVPHSYMDFASAHADKSVPERLRMAFEELGPTFVKFGQLLSTRSDLLPEAYLEELTKLQDNVNPLDFSIVRQVVEQELGGKITKAFASFNEKPLASASIGQVHEAELLSGERVVVKVQRPEIEKIVRTDVSLLAFLAGMLERYIPETRVISPKLIVDEFFSTLLYELDFAVEANNTIRSAKNLTEFTDIVIPKVYREQSTRRILTLERIEGIRVNDAKAMQNPEIDKKKIVDIGARAFFKSVMIDGFFHGDLHGGNWFVLPGNKIGIVDFGIVGRLSEKARDQLAGMLMSLLNEDYERLCYLYAELGASGPTLNFDDFHREIRNTLSPYLGLSLNEINAGKVLTEATKIAAKYEIRVPGDWMMVFKAIITIEGIGRQLSPDFDIVNVGQELAKELVKNQYSPQRLTKDFLAVARDVASLMQTLPRQIKWMLRKFSQNDFALELRLPDVERLRKQSDLNARRLSSSILIAGLFIAGSLSMSLTGGHRVGDYPLVSVLMLGLGCVFLVILILKSLR